jgi:tetratricopeptide (TPR) repeat protein
MIKNRSGEEFLARSNKAIPLLSLALLTLLLAACASTPQAPDGQEVVEQRVRQPAREDSAGVQVFPLQNPAVKELLADAGAAESSGNYDQAAMLLERALRIQPNDPEILQNMAEVQLHVNDFEQALHFASRSYDIGPRVGEICSRNWRTISVAREYLGDTAGSIEAEQKASACMNTRPKRL